MAPPLQGSSKSSCKEAVLLHATNGDTERKPCRVAFGLAIFIMAVLTVLNFCSALGVVDLRVTRTSIHSSVDIYTDKYRTGPCPCDVEMARVMQRVISLEAQVENLKHQASNVGVKMEAFNLEVYNIHVKELETAVRVSNLIQQSDEAGANLARMNGSVSASLARINASMEALNVEVFNIHYKDNETDAKVATLMEQNEEASVTFAKINASLEALNHELSDVQMQVNDTAARVSTLTKQKEEIRDSFSQMNAAMNSIAQRTSSLESRRMDTNNSNSNFRPRNELSAAAFVIIFVCTFLLVA